MPSFRFGRVLPVQIKNNRELSKVAKAAIGDMLVPEDVAVKWWLVKKREKAAQKSAYIVRLRAP